MSPAIGMEMRWHCAIRLSGRPGPSAPRIRARRCGGVADVSVSAAGRRERPGCDACRDERGDDFRSGSGVREGQAEGGARGNADGFAVERVAAGVVEQDSVCAEGGSVAETAAHIVMVGEADQHEQRERTCGQGSDELFSRLRRRAPRDGKYAAVDVEAGDAVHDGLRRHVGGNVGRQVGENGRQGFGAVFGEEQGFDGEARSGEKAFQRDGAFDDETVCADEVAVADGAVERDAGIVGRVNGREHARVLAREGPNEKARSGERAFPVLSACRPRGRCRRRAGRGWLWRGRRCRLPARACRDRRPC